MQNFERQKLLKQVVGGDRLAFCALLETYYIMIYSTAFKWIGNKENAEDIAQEACIKIGCSIGHFRMESRCSTWLYRIVLNTAKDFQRKQYHQNDINKVSHR